MAESTPIEAVRVPGDRRAQSAYSAAVRAGGFLFVSGLGPLDLQARVVGEGIHEQAHETMRNLVTVLKAGGASIGELASLRVYLADMEHYAAFNSVYEEYVRAPYPARICIGAGALWEGVLVEIEAIAYLSDQPSPPGDE